MSSSKRMPLLEAQALAADVIDLIADVSGETVVAGSIRREQETVGDIEIVCLPYHRAGLLVRLDGLLEKGTITQALYRHKDSQGHVRVVPRWGDRLRCFVFQGVTVELAIADADNFGYLLWLRTGPADGNKFVMVRLRLERARVRFDRGYGWLVDYAGAHPIYRQVLHLPDEEALFTALRIPLISPTWRGERLYKANWRGAASLGVLRLMVAETVEQKNLFE